VETLKVSRRTSDAIVWYDIATLLFDQQVYDLQ
jgi:hypothetical protein